MPIKIIFFLALLFTLSAVVPGQSSKPAFTEYGRLSPKQRILIDVWGANESLKTGTSISPAERFQALSPSQHSVFEAITNALISTRLTGPKGEKLGTALDLIAEVESISGEDKSKGSDEQFRLYVRLVPAAKMKLTANRQLLKGKNNTVFHHNYPLNFRQAGKAPTLQFSITEDFRRADVDIDYRSSGFPAALFNGHLTAANSDVRVVGNYQKHLVRWPGLIDWWDDIIDTGDFGLAGRGADRARTPASSVELAELHRQVAEFLDLWLLKRNPDGAIGYASANLPVCVDARNIGNERIFRERRRTLLRDSLAAVGKEMGRISALGNAIFPIDPADVSHPVIEHPNAESFALFGVTDSYYEHFVCEPNAGLVLSARPDGAGSNYYVSAFGLKLKNGGGGGLKLFWARENGNWKIVTFDVVSS